MSYSGRALVLQEISELANQGIDAFTKVRDIKRYIEQNCEHIYKNMGAPICPICGRDTHETDWSKQHELHREWIASGKAQFGGWWSI